MLNALSRPRSARPCCIFVAYDFKHRVGNLLRVVGIDKSCRGIVENLSMSRNVGYEHRTVAGHRFEDRIRAALVLAKKRKDSCCFHQAPHAVLRDLSEKPDLVRDAALPREHLQVNPSAASRTRVLTVILLHTARRDPIRWLTPLRGELATYRTVRRLWKRPPGRSNVFDSLNG